MSAERDDETTTPAVITAEQGAKIIALLERLGDQVGQLLRERADDQRASGEVAARAATAGGS